MISSRTVSGEGFEDGDAVANERTANAVFHLKATRKTRYRSFNKLSFSAYQIFSGEDILVANWPLCILG